MQSQNPYLPINVCIADGEPHVFGEYKRFPTKSLYRFTTTSRVAKELSEPFGFNIPQRWNVRLHDAALSKNLKDRTININYKRIFVR